MALSFALQSFDKARNSKKNKRNYFLNTILNIILMEIGNALPIMFNNMEEVEFLRAQLKPNYLVLEWGSGGSTLEIAKHVKGLVSIEHHKEWYNKVKAIAPQNVHIIYVPKNKEEAIGHDGTFIEYEDYINAPLIAEELRESDYENLQGYHVIFIDGRARVECAKIAAGLLKPGGFILIHDYRNPDPEYRRYDYEVVEEFLDVVDGAHSLWKFVPKIK